jgi:hypothetical protein
MATEFHETVPNRLAPREKAGIANSRETLEVDEDDTCILRKSTLYLVRTQGMLLVATGIREELHAGSKRWIIAVTLRYPTGHEGYIGDLLYDGKDFEFLTPDEVRDARVKQIAADPEGVRIWNEYRASTLPAGKG